MNKEIIETIKNVKTSDELKDVATKNGYKLTVEEAKGYFDLYHNNGHLNEEELDNVTGGSSCIGGRSYSDDPHGWLIVTIHNSCDGYLPRREDDPDSRVECQACEYHDFHGLLSPAYCTARSRYDDPYNDAVGTKREKLPNGRYW